MLLADGPEIPLLGGDVTEGLVRIGDTVRRPHTPLVEQVLVHLERVGFDGAPRFLGIDAQGRQALSYVEGEVAGRPWPDWVADTERVASVARLVRRYVEAVLPLGLPADSASTRRAEPAGIPASIADPPRFLGHRDVTPENVVFRDGRAAALIDFDLVGPSDAVSEFCGMALWWAPLMPATDREVAVRDVDAVARLVVLADAYGLSARDRSRVVGRARNAADRSWFLMRARAEDLGGGWRRMWVAGIGDQILRRQEWLSAHAAVLHAALTTGTVQSHQS